MKFRRIIDYLYDNWIIINLGVSVCASIIIYLLTLIFPTLNTSRELFICFGYWSVISVIFILLEIRKYLKDDKRSFLTYENMNNAQQSIFKALTNQLKQRKHEPVVLRIYGMRLSGINRTLMDFINSNEKIVWKRNLKIYIYHCAPAYLENMIPHNMEDKKKKEINSMFKEQAKALESYVKGLQRLGKTNRHINFYFRKYHSIPSFWAYEIEKTEVFFGYFTWEHEDWIGPENSCTYINSVNQPIKGFNEWINNHFDGLEDWSTHYD